MSLLITVVVTESHLLGGLRLKREREDGKEGCLCFETLATRMSLRK